MQIDSLQTEVNSQKINQPDSTVAPTVVNQSTVKKKTDTNNSSETVKKEKEETVKTVQKKDKKSYDTKTSLVKTNSPKVTEVLQKESFVANDTLKNIKRQKSTKCGEPIHLFSSLESNDSSKVNSSPESIKAFTTQRAINKFNRIERPQNRSVEKNWVFFSGTFILIILLVIQTYYRKQLASVNSALVNMQLADKLMREKSVLLKRLYIFLTAIYFISLAFFFYQVFNFLKINVPGYSGFRLFLFLLVIISLILLIRFGVNKMIAFIFDAVDIFKEYDYNNQIIHRNLGLILLPILLSSYFVPESITNLVFIISAGLIIVATIFRYFKAVQLLLKHNIVLFYSILYLCTLEILPLLVGIKFVLTLR